MRKTTLHIALLLLILLSGCLNDKRQEAMKKWVVTMDHSSKTPYGAYLAFGSLKYSFPEAKVQTLSSGFRFTNMDNDMRYTANGHKLLILQGFNFFLSDAEWGSLKQFIANGNDVIIFSSIIDSKIEQELAINKKLGGEEGRDYYAYDANHDYKNILSIATDPDKKYGYKGHTIKSYFELNVDTATAAADTATPALQSVTDSTITAIIDSNGSSTETDAGGSVEQTDSTVADDSYDNNEVWYGPDTLGYVTDKVNFVRYNYGKGHLALHAAPLVLSNYFLLQAGNEQYISGVWQTVAKDITQIYWADYHTRSSEASSIDILLKHPATRYALWLALLVLLVFILFESKRKQRIIPIIAPLRNDSVSFVETIGRLYYNKGNQGNLAEKMIIQYLEWVRIHYLLNTNLLNEHFIQQLTIKSGQPEATVRGMVDMIHDVRLKDAKVDDAYLYQLYNTIQQFYKNHRI